MCFTSSAAFPVDDFIDRPGQSQPALDHDQIVAGLEGVAGVLNRRQQRAEIVAIGGAVNTLLLRTRHTTSDVDFFWKTKTKNSVVSAVMDAGHAISRGLGLPNNWLNNHTAVFMREDLISDLYTRGRRQGTIVFQRPGLTVYAAPWDYALCTKLDRLSKPSPRPYDLDDAVAYLMRLFEVMKRPVTVQELESWMRMYGLPIPSPRLLRALNDRFKQKCRGRNGITGLH